MIGFFTCKGSKHFWSNEGFWTTLYVNIVSPPYLEPSQKAQKTYRSFDVAIGWSFSAPECQDRLQLMLTSVPAQPRLVELFMWTQWVNDKIVDGEFQNGRSLPNTYGHLWALIWKFEGFWGKPKPSVSLHTQHCTQFHGLCVIWNLPQNRSMADFGRKPRDAWC